MLLLVWRVLRTVNKATRNGPNSKFTILRAKVKKIMPHFTSRTTSWLVATRPLPHCFNLQIAYHHGGWLYAQMITHPSSNRAWCRATSLIETNALTTNNKLSPLVWKLDWNKSIYWLFRSAMVTEDTEVKKCDRWIYEQDVFVSTFVSRVSRCNLVALSLVIIRHTSCLILYIHVTYGVREWVMGTKSTVVQSLQWGRGYVARYYRAWGWMPTPLVIPR